MLGEEEEEGEAGGAEDVVGEEHGVEMWSVEQNRLRTRRMSRGT